MNSCNYSYEWVNEYTAEKPVMVALHGFTGTKETFRKLAANLSAYNWLLIDHVGHGKSRSEVVKEHYEFPQVIEDLAAILKELKIHQYGLLGYSMGARVALGWAIAYPGNVTKVILESGSPGLQTEGEKRSRRQMDERLARRLETKSLEEFVDFWQDLALFESQKNLTKAVQEEIRNERLSQNPFGLAESLRGMGTGSQPSYWENLAELAQPCLYICGIYDEKFVGIGRKMASMCPRLSLTILENAGHCVHIEQPEVFYQVVSNWLKEKARHED